MSDDNKLNDDHVKSKNASNDYSSPADDNSAAKDEEKVKVVDGKATPTEETVRKTQEIQQADPDVQTTSEPTDPPAAELQKPSDDEKEAKAKAAAEARAARAAARAKKAEGEDQAAPKEPSPNQPRLDRIVQLIKDNVSPDAVEEAFINEKDRHLPYIIIKNGRWFQCAEFLKRHEELRLDYLRNLSGIDQESHMEVAYHLLSMSTKDEYCVKVKTDRQQGSVPSVTPIWQTANWNEREVFDLLGIDFPGHPDLRRIMMSDDWMGHPLRKDYEAIDPEV
jgi:NADH-quinone oxidoreductase subunit C